jgi:hypothetical protein
MIELCHDILRLSCPEVHEDAVCDISFQRTLRVPDDNEAYPLPAGLGAFPLEYTARYADRAPKAWSAAPGVFLPMYQSEAMWMSFGAVRSESHYPFALKIAAGEINAVSGNAMAEGLSRREQDYIVLPDQPWLDGFCIHEGYIRQFIAMRLGEGYTAEEQLTGRAEHGGVRFMAYPMKRERYEELERVELDMPDLDMCVMSCQSESMGLAPGGVMEQAIYQDSYGPDAWDLAHGVACTLHIANSRDYLRITGRCPPTLPATEEQYREAGIPWFKYYNADANVLRGAPRLAALSSVKARGVELGVVSGV